MSYLLAVHGGAGTIQTGGDEAPYHAGLRQALAAGEAILRDGGSAFDAVAAAVVVLEDLPLFNAGHGAVFTAAEQHELDAGIMDGASLRAGAVATLRRVRNPILAARAVWADQRFVLLGGQAADQFAEDAGLAMVENTYFSTARRREQLHKVQALDARLVVLDHTQTAGLSLPGSELDHSRKFGTVGAVALDLQGHLAAATSTGGMTNKHPGRIGDTPMVGAGVYANDLSCAVSTTGTGEHFMRACVAYDIHARMHYGAASLDVAAHAAVAQSLAGIGGEGGLIAIGRDGSLAMPFNSLGMYRGWVRGGQDSQTQIFR